MERREGFRTGPGHSVKKRRTSIEMGKEGISANDNALACIIIPKRQQATLSSTGKVSRKVGTLNS